MLGRLTDIYGLFCHGLHGSSLPLVISWQVFFEFACRNSNQTVGPRNQPVILFIYLYILMFIHLLLYVPILWSTTLEEIVLQHAHLPQLRHKGFRATGENRETTSMPLHTFTCDRGQQTPKQTKITKTIKQQTHIQSNKIRNAQHIFFLLCKSTSHKKQNAHTTKILKHQCAGPNTCFGQLAIPPKKVPQRLCNPYVCVNFSP